jgi:hypothetical protein
VRITSTLAVAAITGLVMMTTGLKTAAAQGFAGLVSPPRFELTARVGTTLRQTLDISNRSADSAHYRIHTADFDLTAQYGVTFHDDLQPGSCRPWVALERGDVTLPGGGTMRYRFEIAVPASAALPC